MTTIELLGGQLKSAHQSFFGTLEGVTNEVANFQPQGKALSIGAIWAHAVLSEDMFITMTLKGGQMLLETDFAQKSGTSQPHPMISQNWAEEYNTWAKTVTITVDQLLTYTKAVFTASEAYLTTLTPEDLDQTKDMDTMGKMPVSDILANIVIAHANNINGEISAIKGIQNLKGYLW